jgi:hypothetical protein
MAVEPPPATLQPMSTFDPSQPALLHDQLNDTMLPWTGEQRESWRAHARIRSDGLAEWDGDLFDGWCEPLGG